MDTFGDLFQECRRDLFIGWVFSEIDRNKDFRGFRVYIANIYTTFVRE